MRSNVDVADRSLLTERMILLSDSTPNIFVLINVHSMKKNAPSGIISLHFDGITHLSVPFLKVPKNRIRISRYSANTSEVEHRYVRVKVLYSDFSKKEKIQGH